MITLFTENKRQKGFSYKKNFYPSEKWKSIRERWKGFEKLDTLFFNNIFINK